MDNANVIFPQSVETKNEAERDGMHRFFLMAKFLTAQNLLRKMLSK